MLNEYSMGPRSMEDCDKMAKMEIVTEQNTPKPPVSGETKSANADALVTPMEAGRKGAGRVWNKVRPKAGK